MLLSAAEATAGRSLLRAHKQNPCSHQHAQRLSALPFQAASPCSKLRCVRLGHCRRAVVAATTRAEAASSGTELEDIVNAEAAVNRGLEAFKGGKAGEAATKEALALFQRAMELQPSRPEAQAALYNAGCCLVKLKRWQEAVDAVEEAINEQGLKYKVADEDPDLAPLRERREWLDAVGRLKGNVSDKTLVQLRSEAKAPFRLARLIIGGGLLAGASVGLAIISFRLFQALSGGEGAPDVDETLKNLGINGVAVAALGWLVRRDQAASERDQLIVQREELLARLQVSLGADRVLPLAAFRGTTRPVLLAGSRSFLNKATAAAEPFREQLRQRGVSIVPLRSSAAEAADPTERLKALKREFQKGTQSGSAKGFADSKPKPAKPAAAKEVTQQDRKWQLEAYDVPEWLQWVRQQQEAANVEEGANVYIQVSLDGTVRSSGLNIPPWERFVGDLAPLDDIRTKLTRQ